MSKNGKSSHSILWFLQVSPIIGHRSECHSDMQIWDKKNHLDLGMFQPKSKSFCFLYNLNFIFSWFIKTKKAIRSTSQPIFQTKTRIYITLLDPLKNMTPALRY